MYAVLVVLSALVSCGRSQAGVIIGNAIAFPVSANVSFDFGGSTLSGGLNSAGRPNSAVRQTDTDIELITMDLVGTGGLSGITQLQIGSVLGLPPTTGTSTSGSAFFDVFFQASGTDAGISFTATNSSPLRVSPVLLPGEINPFAIGKTWQSTGTVSVDVLRSDGTSGTGLLNDFDFTLAASQDVPLLPTFNPETGIFQFRDGISGAFYDPPAASGFDYAITSPGSLFTKITFPTGFGSNLMVSSGGTSFGTFGPGDMLNFSSGVSSFSLTGIAPPVDPSDPLAFPLQLEFNTPTASFDMTAISAAAVPEPSSLVLFCLGTVGMMFFVIRGHKKGVSDGLDLGQ